MLIDIAIGIRLATLRRKAGLTRERLARAASLTRARLEAMEVGSRISAVEMFQLCQALNVGPADLLDVPMDPSIKLTA